MRNLTTVARVMLLLTALMATGVGADYTCEYSNSEVTGNDATNRTVGIAVLSEDNFVLSINRKSIPYYALCKWTDATATTGRGNDVQQWFWNFDTVNLEEPYGIGVDDNDYVYVANNDPDHNILVFDASGSDPVALPFRLATSADDTIYTIDLDDEGHVYVGLCNAVVDRVDVYPPISDDMWMTHTGSPLATIFLPDGIYTGLCVNGAGTEVYLSEYTSANISRYIGSPATGFTLDGGFNFSVDSLATAIDVDDAGYLYVAQDHWLSNPFGYSYFWVVDLSTGVVTDLVNMDQGGASATSAGYYSAIDIEVDEFGNVYVVHYYAWAMEKWFGSPSPVPVVLTSFEATCGQGYIALNWVTASEINCHRWEIHRSERENGVYNKMGELPGHGSTEITHRYQWIDRQVCPEETYFYKLKQVDLDGSCGWSPVLSATTGSAIPKTYALHQNYPNPFNASTEIRYQIPKDSHVTLKIFNNLGQEVRTLMNGSQEAGRYMIVWDGQDDGGNEGASGLYFCRLNAGGHSKTIKIVLIK